MKIEAYIKKLQKIAKKYPKIKVIRMLDMDDSICKETSEPQIGNLYASDFIPDYSFEDYDEEKLKVNSVCINF